jgi:uncharacterized protein
MPDDNRPAITIPPAEGRSFTVAAGEAFVVVDVEGQQVADFVALSAADRSEGSSPSQTILFNYPRVRLGAGDFFYSSEGRPMFEIVADDARGVHDFLYAACNSAWYASLGYPGHRNCQDNLAAALAGVWTGPKSALPSPINLFQDTYPDASGAVAARPSPTGPGDAVTLRALMDCVVAVTSCAYDLEAAQTPRPSGSISPAPAEPATAPARRPSAWRPGRPGRSARRPGPWPLPGGCGRPARRGPRPRPAGRHAAAGDR